MGKYSVELWDSLLDANDHTYFIVFDGKTNKLGVSWAKLKFKLVRLDVEVYVGVVYGVHY